MRANQSSSRSKMNTENWNIKLFSEIFNECFNINMLFEQFQLSDIAYFFSHSSHLHNLINWPIKPRLFCEWATTDFLLVSMSIILAITLWIEKTLTQIVEFFGFNLCGILFVCSLLIVHWRIFWIVSLWDNVLIPPSSLLLRGDM